jgi:hypothetical protein
MLNNYQFPKLEINIYDKMSEIHTQPLLTGCNKDNKNFKTILNTEKFCYLKI